MLDPSPDEDEEAGVEEPEALRPGRVRQDARRAGHEARCSGTEYGWLLDLLNDEFNCLVFSFTNSLFVQYKIWEQEIFRTQHEIIRTNHHIS